jgi:hypothetical protein
MKKFLSSFKKPISNTDLSTAIFGQSLSVLLKRDAEKNTRDDAKELIDGDNEFIPTCFRAFILALSQKNGIMLLD